MWQQAKLALLTVLTLVLCVKWKNTLLKRLENVFLDSECTLWYSIQNKFLSKNIPYIDNSVLFVMQNTFWNIFTAYVSTCLFPINNKLFKVFKHLNSLNHQFLNAIGNNM